MIVVMTENEKIAIAILEEIGKEEADVTHLLEKDISELGVLDENTGLNVISSLSLNEILDRWYYVAGSSFNFCIRTKRISFVDWTNEELALSISLDEEWERWKLIELCKRAGMADEWCKAWQAGDSEYEKVAYAAAEKLGVNIDRKDYLL